MPVTKLKKRSANGVKSKASKQVLRLDYVALASDGKYVVCKLNNGALYELPIERFSVAEDYDGSAPVSAKLLQQGYAAVVTFKSGVELDFPLDFVLYNCEPGFALKQEFIDESPFTGESIRECREFAGLSLRELSKKSGIAVPNLSRLEHGAHVPSLRTLQVLSKAFGITVSSLLSGRKAIQDKRRSA